MPDLILTHDTGWACTNEARFDTKVSGQNEKGELVLSKQIKCINIYQHTGALKVGDSVTIDFKENNAYIGTIKSMTAKFTYIGDLKVIDVDVKKLIKEKWL